MHTDPRTISILDYTYDLPEDKIAVYPLPERDASQLLIYKDGNIHKDQYRNIADHLPANSLLVYNNTRVVEARIIFHKPTGGLIEIFCLEPHEQYPDITTAFSQHEKVYWYCLVGGASKWKHGRVLEKRIKQGNQMILLQAHYVEKKKDAFIIEFTWSPAEQSFAEIIHKVGAIPLPPYIKRAPEAKDAETYQTVYAETDGSVAAPTAGLHFTPSIFSSLKKKNILTASLTLHVGAGTFKPVKAERMEGHDMHAEWIDVKKETIQTILDNLGKKIVAVGTTSLRTIESLYWFGVQLSKQKSPASEKEFFLSQWEPYEMEDAGLTAEKALEELINYLDKKKLDSLTGKTQILVTPGYNFKIADGLITNFHQPKSTLLLLVSAFVGDDWKKIYAFALKNNFRFLSYGDGSLLWRK